MKRKNLINSFTLPFELTLKFISNLGEVRNRIFKSKLSKSKKRIQDYSQKTNYHIPFLWIILLFYNMNYAEINYAFTHKENEKNFSSLDFPNAIHITRNELIRILTINDPNGIVSLLSLKTGLSFRNTGDPGAETWFLVRNFGRDNSRLTLVLLDGRPINLSSNHTVEFDDIPIQIIESITIYPGPVPSKYGGFQSVIIINTIKNKDMMETSVSMASPTEYEFNLTLGKAGKFHYIFDLQSNLGIGQTDKYLSGILGNFKYGNREFRIFVPTIKIGYELSDDFDLVIQGNFVDFKKMFDTKPMFGKETSRKRLMHNYSITLQPGKNSNFDYEFVLYQNREQEYLNPIFPEDTTYNVHWGNQKRTLTGLRGSLKNNFFGGRLSLIYGLEGQWAKGSTDDNYLYFKYVNNQYYFASFVQSEIRLWQGSHFTFGLRLDKQKDIRKSYISPVGSVTQNFFDNQVSVYAIYGVQRRWIPLNEVNTFYRPPRVFGPPFLQGNVLLPISTLNMELLKALDIGLKFNFWNDGLYARINFFNLNNKGQYGAPILEIRPVKEGTPLPPTIKAAIVSYDANFPGYDISRGFEFEIFSKPNENLEMFINSTYFFKSYTMKNEEIIIYQGPLSGSNFQQELNKSIGQFILPYHNKAIIPGSYKLLLNSGILYDFDDKTTLTTILRYRSSTKDPIMKFGINPQVSEIPSFLIFDFSVARKIYQRNGINIQMIFSVQNLFDKKYQTFVHYPMVGRSYSFEISGGI